ncbi:MAG: hypothetical protein AUJ60_09240 [Nitrospirae bacterium CG1_02_44_142]|nr:MAG: hypothetical protein AUJ60_09240 [Nitrospirae bacterium CG1_02_44_142]
MKYPKEIKILGAGISGLTAAINLAQYGYRVNVYEKNSDVGMRFYGDFQGLENWSSNEDVLSSLKTMSVVADFYHKPFYEGCFYGPSSNAQVKSLKPIFYLVQRGKDKETLDYSLKKQALSLGVNIIFNTSLNYKDADIIATGPQMSNIIAIGITFISNLEDTAMVVLDDAIAPKGYAYLLVSNQRATLATVLFEKCNMGSQYLQKAIEKFKTIKNFELKNIKNFAGFGNFFLAGSAVRENKIFVGEAAGFQDYLFGFGIRYAITSGYLASKSIIEKIDYNILWQNEFKHKLQTSLSNRALYELFGNTMYDFLVKKTKGCKDVRELWLKFYNPSLSRRLIYPFAFLASKSKNRIMQCKKYA